MSAAIARRLRRARFEFQTREEAAAISEYVAAMVPNPYTIELVLSELMINAIEHGNLEIKEAKPELVREGRLEAEIERRLVDPRFSGRIAWLEVVREDGLATFVVGDAGPGFAWDAVCNPRDGVPCGRGLALVRQLAAWGLEFNAAGNVVTVRVQW